MQYGEWLTVADFTEALNPDGLLHATAGFVVAESQAAVLVAHSIDGSGERAAGCITIPWCAIRSRTRLFEQVAESKEQNA